MSRFATLEAQPKDPIFALVDLYQKDENPNKINLSVGAYRDENGKPYVLPVVKKVIIFYIITLKYIYFIYLYIYIYTHINIYIIIFIIIIAYYNNIFITSLYIKFDFYYLLMI